MPCFIEVWATVIRVDIHDRDLRILNLFLLCFTRIGRFGLDTKSKVWKLTRIRELPFLNVQFINGSIRTVCDICKIRKLGQYLTLDNFIINIFWDCLWAGYCVYYCHTSGLVARKEEEVKKCVIWVSIRECSIIIAIESVKCRESLIQTDFIDSVVVGRH